jgi:hypothetical protein
MFEVCGTGFEGDKKRSIQYAIGVRVNSLESLPFRPPLFHQLIPSHWPGPFDFYALRIAKIFSCKGPPKVHDTLRISFVGYAFRNQIFPGNRQKIGDFFDCVGFELEY